ncbi:MAG: hypothetical protein M3Z50_13485 [Actinomycetota bacterium]|nr:hypothetical protein [Actinomycetota bacterium]
MTRSVLGIPTIETGVAARWRASKVYGRPRFSASDPLTARELVPHPC